MWRHSMYAALCILWSTLGCDRADSEDATESKKSSSSNQVGTKGQGPLPHEGCSSKKSPLSLTPDEGLIQQEDEERTPADDTDHILLLAEPVTYEGQISKLLARACVTCHKPGGDRPDLSTYALAKNGGASSLSTIRRNRMPPRTPLVQEEKDLFQAWVDGGYLQGELAMPSPKPSEPPPPVEPKLPTIPNPSGPSSSAPKDPPNPSPAPIQDRVGGDQMPRCR